MTNQLSIGADKVVSLHFVLRDTDKNILDQSEEGEPLVYLHGVGALVPGLERALEGKKLGDKLDVELAATDAYGPYEPGLCCTISRDEFPETAEIAVGVMFEVSGPDGEAMIAQIVKVEGDSITLDGNHPLAGQDLHFAVQVVGIRPATSEEIEHGHAHTEDDECHTH